MALMLDEDESFSMTAYVESPGYQRVALTGMLVKQEGGETYVGSLLPQMFYGASGEQLSSWRQYLSESGEQVVLSRVGGLPEVPKEEIYWRKVEKKTPTTQVAPAKLVISPIWIPIIGVIGGFILIKILGRK